MIQICGYLAAVHVPGKTEIQKRDLSSVIHHIGDAQIPVDNASAVEVYEYIKELDTDAEDLPVRKLSVLPEEQITESGSRLVSKDKEIALTKVQDAKKFRDCRMGKPG